MRTHYERMLRDTQTRAERALGKQNLDEKSPWFGAFVMTDDVYMQKHTLYCVADMAAVYLNAGSRLYHDEKLLTAMLRGLDFAASTQHENGLFDYITCNFFSAPDTAFCVGIILPAHLRMMLTYIEPDDSIFTANSTRFDKDRLVYPDTYYWPYLYLGVKYGIPEFLAMANYIFKVTDDKKLLAPNSLMQYMLHPELIDMEFAQCGMPESYRAFYPDSDIARVRRGSWTYTVMRDKSDFLYVHNGHIKLAVKLGGSFFEHRAFKAETMAEDADGAFRLHETMRGWYYLPFEEKPATSDWWRMDNASRPKKLGPDMDIDVAVRETPEGIDVEIVTSGVKGAPRRVELAFNGIDRISNEHMTMPVHGDEVLVLRDSFFTVSNPVSSMEVGPAFGLHHFTEGKEDSEAKTPGAATVYLTDYTPFRRVISIRP